MSINRISAFLARDSSIVRRRLLGAAAGSLMALAAGGLPAAASSRFQPPNRTPHGYSNWDPARATIFYTTAPIDAISLAGDRVRTVRVAERPGWRTRRPVTIQAVAPPAGGCNCTTTCTYVGEESGCFCDPYVGVISYFECVGCDCSAYTQTATSCLSDRCRLCNPDGSCNA
jgi:hypothetical protein